ncbi:hypothetical protein [Georgenia sp. H159]|nr:hypothetical protein [Georgenia sp. H159]
MGPIAALTVEDAPTRTRSWRHDLTADYELQQARLRYAIQEAGDGGEYL